MRTTGNMQCARHAAKVEIVSTIRCGSVRASRRWLTQVPTAKTSVTCTTVLETSDTHTPLQQRELQQELYQDGRRGRRPEGGGREQVTKPF